MVLRPVLRPSANALRGALRPCHRAIATTAPRFSQQLKPGSQEPASGGPSSKWLVDLKKRMKISLASDLSPSLTKSVKDGLDYVQSNALELTAGREGFLTDKKWRGLDAREVLWGDMDSMGHVNNVMYNKYAESGRMNWVANLAEADPAHRQEWMELATPRSVGLILASIRTDFKFPMTYPDKVTVLHRLLQKPDYDSDRLYLDVFIYSEQHQRPVARCYEDVVVYDYRAGKKATLQPFMIDELRKIYDMQEMQRQKAETEIRRLYSVVEQTG